MSIRVLLVDDHALIRNGLRATLVEEAGFDVVGEAGNYAQWREQMRTTQSDVMVLDINLPGRSGIEILQALGEYANPPGVLVLSQYGEDQYGIRALKAGAMGYLNKAADTEEIISAIRRIASGQRVVNASLADALVESITNNGDKAAHDALTERELQTCILIARGVKLADMATQLAISRKTVSVYRTRIKDKLELGSNAEIAAYAIRNGLID